MTTKVDRHELGRSNPPLFCLAEGIAKNRASSSFRKYPGERPEWARGKAPFPVSFLIVGAQL